MNPSAMNPSAPSSLPSVDCLPKTSWRDCLNMSPDVAAIVMGVTTAEAETRLRVAATRRSRLDRAEEVVGDFKHSALWQLSPGHAALTQTYRLILNKPIAETYRCRGCCQPQPLPDSGLQPLCLSCSHELQSKIEKQRKAVREREAARELARQRETIRREAV